jgi:hypothetical protein
MAFRMNCRVLRFRPPARPHNDGAGVSVPNAVASASFASDWHNQSLCRKLACQLQREPGLLIYLAQARGERRRIGHPRIPAELERADQERSDDSWKASHAQDRRAVRG